MVGGEVSSQDELRRCDIQYRCLQANVGIIYGVVVQ